MRLESRPMTIFGPQASRTVSALWAIVGISTPLKPAKLRQKFTADEGSHGSAGASFARVWRDMR